MMHGFLVGNYTIHVIRCNWPQMKKTQQTAWSMACELEWWKHMVLSMHMDHINTQLIACQILGHTKYSFRQSVDSPNKASGTRITLVTNQKHAGAISNTHGNDVLIRIFDQSHTYILVVY